MWVYPDTKQFWYQDLSIDFQLKMLTKNGNKYVFGVDINLFTCSSGGIETNFLHNLLKNLTNKTRTHKWFVECDPNCWNVTDLEKLLISNAWPKHLIARNLRSRCCQTMKCEWINMTMFLFGKLLHVNIGKILCANGVPQCSRHGNWYPKTLLQSRWRHHRWTEITWQIYEKMRFISMTRV